MITGELKSSIGRVWDAFWCGGISNPIEAIEQITYLLFGPDHANLAWSHLKNASPEVTFATNANDMFPFLCELGTQACCDGSTYSEHVRDARFTIPTPGPAQQSRGSEPATS